MFVLKNIDDCLFWAPDIKVKSLVLRTTLQNDLLGLVKLGQEDSFGIATSITFDLLCDRLCYLQVLIDFTLHEHTRLVCFIWEKLYDLHGVF